MLVEMEQFQANADKIQGVEQNALTMVEVFIPENKTRSRFLNGIYHGKSPFWCFRRYC